MTGKSRHLRLMGIVLLIMAGVLSACQLQSGADKVGEIANPTATSADATEIEQATETDVMVEEATAEPQPTMTANSNAAPTPRAGLAGTDPSTVQLASGEIQLVEFFAFW